MYKFGDIWHIHVHACICTHDVYGSISNLPDNISQPCRKKLPSLGSLPRSVIAFRYLRIYQWCFTSDYALPVMQLGKAPRRAQSHLHCHKTCKQLWLTSTRSPSFSSSLQVGTLVKRMSWKAMMDSGQRRSLSVESMVIKVVEWGSINMYVPYVLFMYMYVCV